jgi:hypothetical protein
MPDVKRPKHDGSVQIQLRSGGRNESRTAVSDQEPGPGPVRDAGSVATSLPDPMTGELASVASPRPRPARPVGIPDASEVVAASLQTPSCEKRLVCQVVVPATEATCELVTSTSEALFPKSRLSAHDDLIIARWQCAFTNYRISPNKTSLMTLHHKVRSHDFFARGLCLCISSHIPAAVCSGARSCPCCPVTAMESARASSSP